MCEFSFERSKFIQKPVGHQNPFKITDLDMYSSKNRRDDFSRIYADTPNKLLAYPKLGLVSRNQFSSRKDHKDQVKNTMHDRFDIIMGNQKEKNRPWNQSDWDHFHEWFQLRAQSRKRQIIEPEKCRKVPLETLLPKINELSKPRRIRKKYVSEVFVPFKRTEYKEIPYIRPEKKRPMSEKRVFSASTLKLSTPKKSHQDLLMSNPSKINLKEPTAAQMEKDEDLAVPKKDLKIESDMKVPTVISKFALQATPSKRTIKLAEPVMKVEAKEESKDSTKISKNALNAKATERTIQLSKPSKPREIIKDFKEKASKWKK